jgi:hypothetical protein
LPIGCARYSKSVLPPDHLDALHEAADSLAESFFQDVQDLGFTDHTFEETEMVSYLPRKYLPRYDDAFAKAFLTCLLVVAWKIVAPGKHRLASVGEELALYAIERHAHALYEEKHGEEPDFSSFDDVAYEDVDFQFLFQPAFDGIEEGVTAEVGRIVNLTFDDWFKSFRDDNPAHPFAQNSSARGGDEPDEPAE